jgi:hypothetical protein
MSNLDPITRFTKIVAGGNLATIGEEKKLGATVELCVAGNFNSQSRFDDFVLYDQKKIGCKLYATDGQGKVQELSHETFHSPWHIAVAGNLGDSPNDDLLLYNRNTGNVQFLSVTSSGELQRGRRDRWLPRWDMIISGIFSGTRFADLLFYNRHTGRREFYTTNRNQSIDPISDRNIWSTGWENIIAGNFDDTTPITELMFYDRNQGFIQFYALSRAGRLQTQPIRQQRWGRSWDIIVPGNFGGDGRTDLFCYDRDSDKAQFWAFTDGTFRKVGSTLLMDRKWQHIVPGNFADGQKTDLLFIG